MVRGMLRVKRLETTEGKRQKEDNPFSEKMEMTKECLRYK